MQYYDSDLNSEIDPMEFESDHEPPKEMKYDKKSLLKTKDLKLYKKILEVGEGILRPARYDLVKIKMKSIETDDPDQVDTQQVLDQEIKEFNVGLQEIGEWMNVAMENMRKGEMSIIIIKNIGVDEATQNKTQSFLYNVIKLVDWTTIVDLDQDFNYMKKVLQRGVGNERYSEPDEITFSLLIKQKDRVLLEKEIVGQINLSEHKIPSNVLKLLRTMKRTEICECTIKPQRFLENESVWTCSDINTTDDIIVTINCKDIAHITDIFDDKLVLKKAVRKGVHTSKPENNSEIFFTYQVFNMENNSLIYSSSDTDFDIEDPTWKDIDKLRESDCYRCYLDEYRVSKLLKHCLKVTKKMEIAEVVVLDPAKYVQYGDDYNEIVKRCENFTNVKLKYVIKLYNFTEGKNAFTMTVDDKVFHALRKKEIALAQLKSGNVKKALKVFENVNSYFDLGKFLEEDQIRVQPIQISCLLNTTLCLQKFENWKKLITVADKIINLEPNNIKAIYRKALALKNIQEFEPAIESIKRVMENIETDPTLKGKVDNAMIKELDALLKSTEAAYQTYLKKQKNMYKNMFSAS